MTIKLSKETIRELATLPKHDVFFNVLENEVEIIFKTNIGFVSGDKEAVPASDIKNIDSYFKKVIKRVREMDDVIKAERKRMFGA